MFSTSIYQTAVQGLVLYSLAHFTAEKWGKQLYDRVFESSVLWKIHKSKLYVESTASSHWDDNTISILKVLFVIKKKLLPIPQKLTLWHAAALSYSPKDWENGDGDFRQLGPSINAGINFKGIIKNILNSQIFASCQWVRWEDMRIKVQSWSRKKWWAQLSS